MGEPNLERQTVWLECPGRWTRWSDGIGIAASRRANGPAWALRVVIRLNRRPVPSVPFARSLLPDVACPTREVPGRSAASRSEQNKSVPVAGSMAGDESVDSSGSVSSLLCLAVNRPQVSRTRRRPHRSHHVRTIHWGRPRSLEAGLLLRRSQSSPPRLHTHPSPERPSFTLASTRPNPRTPCRPSTRNPPNPQDGPPPHSDPHTRASIPLGRSQQTHRPVGPMARRLTTIPHHLCLSPRTFEREAVYQVIRRFWVRPPGWSSLLFCFVVFFTPGILP
ncbi:hypothetical protein LX36DRAFT_85712 [Colletotrichum falcatum]|nr:hypothetical protein LX36DRAFT_85712 [Colletotrichum falcatum]